MFLHKIVKHYLAAYIVHRNIEIRIYVVHSSATTALKHFGRHGMILFDAVLSNM